MKILIIRFSSIGDIVLTTPVIRCVKKQVQNAEIHFVTKKSFKSILENNPHIDKLHLLDNSFSELVNVLKNEKFDVILDLHKNMRTLKLKLALGVKAYSFDKLNVQKWLLVNMKINKMPYVHIVDRYLHTAKALGVINDGLGLDYFIPDKDQIDLNIYNIPENYISFAIGGQHATKKLPNDKIIEIVKNQNYTVVLLGGKEDFENGEKITSQFNDTQCINLCGKLNLNQSAFVVQQSLALITHDTGLMHIAAALKKKVLAIWGNTVPELGMYPYLTEHVNFEVKDLSCRPCSKIGFDKCPKTHFKCMTSQAVEKIVG